MNNKIIIILFLLFIILFINKYTSCIHNVPVENCWQFSTGPNVPVENCWQFSTGPNVPVENCWQFSTGTLGPLYGNYEHFDEFYHKIPINIIQKDYSGFIDNKWINIIIDNLKEKEQQIKNSVKNENFRPYRIVVCLTTSPKRLPKIEVVLNNMLKQTLVPDAIYVFIPKVFKRTGETYDQVIIDKYYKLSPLVKCTIIEEDLGPITKILPVINYEKDPQTIAVSIDDDILYDNDMLYHYYCKSLIYNDAIITGNMAIRQANYYKTYPLFEGYLGIAYKIYHVLYINDEFHKNYKKLGSSCIGSDDFIIANIIWSLNFRIFNCHFDYWNVTALDYGKSDDALHNINLDESTTNISKDENSNRYFNCKKKIIDNNIPLFLYSV